MRHLVRKSAPRPSAGQLSGCQEVSVGPSSFLFHFLFTAPTRLFRKRPFQEPPGFLAAEQAPPVRDDAFGKVDDLGDLFLGSENSHVLAPMRVCVVIEDAG